MEPAQENSIPKDGRAEFWKELFKLLVLAVIIVIPFRIFVARPFIVDGSSMYPTFKDGQYLIVDELTYHWNSPQRGSVLIFKYPNDPKKKFIKRIIGLPGETVSIQDGKITIINAEHPEGFELNEDYVQLQKSDTQSYVLEEDEYYVMGDNRSASADSRIWGPVPKANIIGRPILRFYPPAFMPGQFNFEEVNNNNP
jgi:signal peptidase I